MYQKTGPRQRGRISNASGNDANELISSVPFLWLAILNPTSPISGNAVGNNKWRNKRRDESCFASL
jgi:hypothetical protein